MIDEFSIVDYIKSNFQDEDFLIGDDCAVYGDFLISLDQMVEDTHFRFSSFPPFYIGKKVVSSTVSDVAAMGGIPLLLFLGITIRKNLPFNWLEKFLGGINSGLKDYNIKLAGGDISRGDKISISSTVFGRKYLERVLTRRGGKIGDVILLTLRDGFSHLGMEKVYGDGFSEEKLNDPDVKKFLDPVALVDVGKFFVESNLVNCCIDVSDGILRDLKNLCREADLSAVIFSSNIEDISSFKGVPVDIFLKGGEEFELLFSVEKKSLNKFLKEFNGRFKGIKVSIIGEFIEKRESFIYSLKNGKLSEIKEDGFDHFGGEKNG